MAERIRVLSVIARMNLGGPAVIAAELTRRLDPARFEHRLVVGDVGDNEGDFLATRAPDLPVVRVAGLGRDVRAGGDVRALRELRRTMREFRPDIVHTHTTKVGTLGRLAAWSCRGPATVHMFHGHHLHGYFSPLTTRALVTFERGLAWRTTRLVAVGTRVRDELLAAGIGRPEQYTVVAPGIAPLDPPPPAEARARLGLPADRPVVSFVARLTGVKRPDRLLDVAAAVARTRPDALFVIVGDGELAGEVRARAEALESVRVLGWRADVETVFGASDLTILTSDNEGMPVSLIEAAMCGVPAVAPGVGSIPEVVLDGVTGFVRPAEVAALAEAVVTLLGDDARRRAMGTAAAAHADATFSSARLVADISAIYEAIAARRRADERSRP